MDASAVIDSMRFVKTVLNLTILHLAATHDERLQCGCGRTAHAEAYFSIFLFLVVY